MDGMGWALLHLLEMNVGFDVGGFFCHIRFVPSSMFLLIPIFSSFFVAMTYIRYILLSTFKSSITLHTCNTFLPRPSLSCALPYTYRTVSPNPIFYLGRYLTYDCPYKAISSNSINSLPFPIETRPIELSVPGLTAARVQPRRSSRNRISVRWRKGSDRHVLRFLATFQGFLGIGGIGRAGLDSAKG